MNPKLFKAMRQKKKREPDPNAPPRPNLLSHDVKIRQQDDIIDRMNREVHYLKDTVRRLENKLFNQTNYLDALHNKLRK
jgi:predicted RNase H-like nuclease (RuvC/YqgF family)